MITTHNKSIAMILATKLIWFVHAIVLKFLCILSLYMAHSLVFWKKMTCHVIQSSDQLYHWVLCGLQTVHLPKFTNCPLFWVTVQLTTLGLAHLALFQPFMWLILNCFKCHFVPCFQYIKQQLIVHIPYLKLAISHILSFITIHGCSLKKIWYCLQRTFTELSLVDHCIRCCFVSHQAAHSFTTQVPWCWQLWPYQLMSSIQNFWVRCFILNVFCLTFCCFDCCILFVKDVFSVEEPDHEGMQGVMHEGGEDWWEGWPVMCRMWCVKGLGGWFLLQMFYFSAGNVRNVWHVKGREACRTWLDAWKGLGWVCEWSWKGVSVVNRLFWPQKWFCSLSCVFCE